MTEDRRKFLSKQNVHVNIELEKINYSKPYLGGYVNKANGSYYFHAYGQTDQYINEHKVKIERDTMTQELVTRSTKMNREFGTQTNTYGLYVDPRKDKIIDGKKYFSAVDWEGLEERTVLNLQRKVRGWLAFRYISKKEEKVLRKGKRRRN